MEEDSTLTPLERDGRSNSYDDSTYPSASASTSASTDPTSAFMEEHSSFTLQSSDAEPSYMESQDVMGNLSTYASINSSEAAIDEGFSQSILEREGAPDPHRIPISKESTLMQEQHSQRLHAKKRRRSKKGLRVERSVDRLRPSKVGINASKAC